MVRIISEYVHHGQDYFRICWFWSGLFQNFFIMVRIFSEFVDHGQDFFTFFFHYDQEYYKICWCWWGLFSEFVHRDQNFFRICWCWFISYDDYTAFETLHNTKPNCWITKNIKNQMMGPCLFKPNLDFSSSVVFSAVQYSIEPFFQLWGKISSDANRWVHTRAQYDCFSTPGRSQKPGQKNKYFFSNSIPSQSLLPKRPLLKFP